MNNYKIEDKLINILDELYDGLSPIEVLEVSRYFLEKMLNYSSWWDFDDEDDYRYFNKSLKKIIKEIINFEEW